MPKNRQEKKNHYHEKMTQNPAKSSIHLLWPFLLFLFLPTTITAGGSSWDAQVEAKETLLSPTRAKRWIALSGFSHYQQQQKNLRTNAIGGRIFQFASNADDPRNGRLHPSGDVGHHLETKVAAVFNKVAFRKPINQENTTVNILNVTNGPPELIEIVPTSEKPSSTSPKVTTTSTKAPTTTTKGNFDGKKRARNQKKPKKPTRTPDETLKKLGSISKQILYGSSTPMKPDFTKQPPVVTSTVPPTKELPKSTETMINLMNISAKILAPPEDLGDSAESLVKVYSAEEVNTTGPWETELRSSNNNSQHGLFFNRGSAWDAHVYIFMPLFVILVLAGIICVLKLATSRHMALSKGYNVAIVIFVVTMGSAQCVSLFSEFYRLGIEEEVFRPRELGQAMSTLTLPCLTSSFAVLFLALLDATRLRVMSPYVQNPVSIAGIVVLHFLLAVCGVMTIGDTLAGKFIFLLGQIVFVMWSLGLVFGYIYAARALSRMAKTMRLQEAIAGDGKFTPNLMDPIRAGLVVAMLMSLVTVVAIYTMVLSVLDSRRLFAVGADPWPWWASHVALRVLEWLIGAVLLYIARMPRQQKRLGVKATSSCRNTMSSCFSTLRRGHRYRNGISDVTAVWQTQGFGAGPEEEDGMGEADDLYPTCCNTNQAVKNFERTNGRPVYSDSLAVGNLHLHSNGADRCFAIAMNKRRQASNNRLGSRRSNHNTLGGHEGCPAANGFRVIDTARTELIDRNSCSCSRPVSILSSESRYTREQLVTSNNARRTLESSPESDIPTPHSIQSPITRSPQRRPSAIDSNDFGHYHQGSPAYQLPADCQRPPRARNAARRNYSNASVQTNRSANTVCVQTSQTSPVIMLQKRGSQSSGHPRSVSRDRDGSMVDNSSRGSSLFDIDKHISACSSESAAASFDVHMYLNDEPGLEKMNSTDFSEPEEDGFPACDIPDPVIDSNMFLPQISGQSSYTSLPSLEVASLMLPPPNDSPMRRHDIGTRMPPPTSFRTVLQQHFGNTLLTHQEPNSTDITPDSAVVADISQSSAGMESFMDDLAASAPFMEDMADDDEVHSKRSVTSSLSDFWKLSTRSINDLFKSSPMMRQSKRKAKDILDKLQGSNFSLNTAASRMRQYSPLDCEADVASVSSLKRFCSEYEMHLAEMDSMLNAEMKRMSEFGDDDTDSALGAVGIDPDSQHLLSPDDHWDNPRRSQGTAFEEDFYPGVHAAARRDFDTQTEEDWVLEGSPYKRRMSNRSAGETEQPMRMDSIEFLDSINQENGEDYGESDVNVDPTVLKAKILKVCDNIRQFSDSRPQFRRPSKTVESAF